MGADPYKNCAYTIGVKLSERDGGFKKVFEIGSLDMDYRAEGASGVCCEYGRVTWKPWAEGQFCMLIVETNGAWCWRRIRSGGDVPAGVGRKERLGQELSSTLIPD